MARHAGHPYHACWVVSRETRYWVPVLAVSAVTHRPSLGSMVSKGGWWLLCVAEDGPLGDTKASRSVIRLTRLETRTKESNIGASRRVLTRLGGEMNVIRPP